MFSSLVRRQNELISNLSDFSTEASSVDEEGMFKKYEETLKKLVETRGKELKPDDRRLMKIDRKAMDNLLFKEIQILSAECKPKFEELDKVESESKQFDLSKMKEAIHKKFASRTSN